jgi:hypothetical protein
MAAWAARAFRLESRLSRNTSKVAVAQAPAYSQVALLSPVPDGTHDERQCEPGTRPRGGPKLDADRYAARCLGGSDWAVATEPGCLSIRTSIDS